MKMPIAVFLFLLIVALCPSIQGEPQPQPSNQQHPQRQQSHHHRSSHLHHSNHQPKSLVAQGNSQVVKGITVHGAIIVSDHLEGNEVKAAIDASIIPTATAPGSDDIKRLSSARVRNFQVLQDNLPFNLTKWSAVFTGPCPHYSVGHRTERGLMWAHYRIWRDFIYFDPEILSFATDTTNPMRRDKEFITSADGVFTGYRDGRLIKNQTPYKDDDIIVIFEDDAYSAIEDTATTVKEELSMLGEDILYLGWCEGREARPAPLCAHAYAVKRKAVRKLVHYFEPCGRAVDEQLVIFIKNNWLTYRRAHPWSFKVLSKAYNPINDTNYGIFRQCKVECGSVNGHRRLTLETDTNSKALKSSIDNHLPGEHQIQV